MGIIAQCPNGHGTKVKDQYAGKKVICPQCGVTFRVPKAAPLPAAPASLPVARVVPLAPSIVATLPRAVALGAAAGPAPAALPIPTSFAPPPEPSGMQPRPVEPVPMAFPPAPAFTPPAFAPAMHPLIAEQPAASWSLAVPGGEASAPMSGAEFQQWLDARQATGSELVWRSDWPDWVPIVQVFPECVPPAAPWQTL